MASVKFKKALTKAQYDALLEKDPNAIYFLEGNSEEPNESNVRLMVNGKDYSGVKKIETGTTAGTIKVDGVDVAVKNVGDVTTKADKVTSATNGNFAGLDSNGNLTDSGSKAADFATAVQGATADTAVQSVKITGSETELKDGTNVVLPAYPTTLPASDVYDWAKAATKPSYTASEVGAIDATTKGVANGVAELDANGKVPSSQLPSYVDDVLEFNTKSDFPAEGEEGKIYVNKANNTTWRWSGTQYTQIKGDLVIGTTTGTAADGGTVNTHITDTDIHVTTSDKSAWNAKYDKPSGGIPSTDMSDAVQASLALADSALQSHQDITGKADKVTSATNGNFAALDSNGNLTDSGHKASDFQTAGNYKTTQTAVSDPTANGNSYSYIDSISQNTNGEISVTKKTIPDAAASTSGVGGTKGLMSAADKETIDNLSTDLSAKADKVTSATNGNFAGLDSNGNLTDSGKAASDFVETIQIDGTTQTKTNGVVNLPAYPTKISLSLDNVTNDAQVKRSEMGVANGVATLGTDGKVPSAQLPSYVDDVIEGYYYNGAFYADATHETVITAETGKIYVDITSGVTPANKSYRYGGSAYIEIVASPGSTDNVAEGSVNLYYTDSRADARVAAGIAALDATVTSSNGTNVQVQVVEANGVITGVNVSTDNTVNSSDVSSAITTAIEALDATPAQTAGADGLALSLTQADGVVTGISGSIAANTYDAYGDAAAVLGTASDAAGIATVYGVKAMLEWD